MEPPLPPSSDYDLDAPSPVGEPGLPPPDAPQPAFCLNCSATLTGRFCANCGQENEPSRLSVGALLRDVWENFIAVDAKLLRTLWLLLVKPGFLTNEYLDGRRQRYISPFKLYFWATALFAVFSYRTFYIEDEVLQGGQKKGALVAAAAEQVRQGKDPSDTVSEIVGNGRSKTPETERHADAVVEAARAGDLESAVAHAEQLAATPPAKAKPDPEVTPDRILSKLDVLPVNLFGVRINPETLPASVSAYEEQQRRLLPAERDGGYVRFFKIKVIRFRKNRSDAIRNLIYSTVPNVLLFAVPLWALMMVPFFLRPRRLYVEHLIYVLHAHTVLVILILMRLAIGKLVLEPYPGLSAEARAGMGNLLTQGTVVYILGYMFVASRRVYRQKIPVLLAKGGCLTAGYGCILIWATLLGIVVTLIATLLNL